MKFILLLIISLVLSEAIAQQKLNTDSLFLKAREYAFSDDYENAQSICYQILEAAPDYADARILLTRTYAWDKKHDLARKTIQPLIDTTPKIQDAFIAAIDNEIWSGNYGKADKLCRQALENWPGSPLCLLKLAQTQYHLAEYQPALVSVDSVLAQEPENIRAQDLRDLILRELKQDKIKLGHSVEWFDTPYSQQLHISSIEYIKKLNRFTIIPRLNMGQTLLDTTSFFSDLHPQAEIDIYYQISAWNYLYFNYGYAFKQFFPKHRHGLEFYQKLPLGFEASLGYRFLYFVPDIGDSKFVDIYTGSLGKYWKKFWFSGRIYVTPQTSGVDNSYQLTARYFYNDKNDFIELVFNSGFSVDESVYAQQTFASTEYLSSYRIGINGQYTYKRIFTLHGSTAVRFEEYFQNKNRSVFYCYAGISFFL